jgi:hypothetical protein
VLIEREGDTGHFLQFASVPEATSMTSNAERATAARFPCRMTFSVTESTTNGMSSVTMSTTVCGVWPDGFHGRRR